MRGSRCPKYLRISTRHFPLRMSTGWYVEIRPRQDCLFSSFSVWCLALRLQIREVSEREAKVAYWRAAEAQVRVEAESCEIHAHIDNHGYGFSNPSQCQGAFVIGRRR